MNRPNPLPDGWVDLKGKAYPCWPFVLHAAHVKGLTGIETELLQIPDKENGHVAIVRCTATFSPADGSPCAFSALGDASPANVGAFLVPALIRMAETRAKGRALRDACDIGQTLAEEIGPDPDEGRVTRSEPARGASMPPPASPRAGGPDPAFQAASRAERVKYPGGAVYCGEDGCGALLSVKEIEGSAKRWPSLPAVCSVHATERRVAEKDAAGAVRPEAA